MVRKKKQEPSEPSTMTTIAISRTNQNCLNAMRKGYEDYNSILNRLISGQSETYTEVVGIDGELPYLHSCILQLGEHAEKLHLWTGTQWREITFEEANKLMKQPKPNITLTSAEAKEIVADIKELSHKCAHNVETPLYDRLRAFLENQLSDTGKRD